VPSPPPAPIDALYVPATRTMVVTYSAPLMPGVIDPANWYVDVTNQRYATFGPVVAAGSSVTWVHNLFSGGTPPANDAVYLAVPPDLTGVDLQPVLPHITPWHL